MHCVTNMINLTLIALLGAASMMAGAEAQAADAIARVDFKSCHKPQWPAGAQDAKRSGAVTLAFLVNESGLVADSKVAKSSGHSDLDQAALDGIKLCKFVAGVKDGKPMAGWMHMQYLWVLK